MHEAFTRVPYTPSSWIPTDFVGTPRIFERATIYDKPIGQHTIKGGFGPMEPINEYDGPAYYIAVQTTKGEVRIEVRKEVYDLLQINDSIVISYQVGRWSGKLKASIAR